MIEDVYSDNSLITIVKDSNGCATIHTNVGVIHDIAYDVCNSKLGIIDEYDNKLKLLKEEYENKLQREKVHISRGGRVSGNRVYGRRCKIAIPKRSFRNQKGIIGFPNGAL